MANSRNIIDGCASVLSWAVTRTFKTIFSHVRKKYLSKKHILIFDYQMSTLKRYLRSSFVEAGRNEKSSGFNSVVAVLPVLLLLYLIPAAVVVVLLYWRFVYFKTKYYWLRVQKSIATENYLFYSFFFQKAEKIPKCRWKICSIWWPSKRSSKPCREYIKSGLSECRRHSSVNQRYIITTRYNYLEESHRVTYMSHVKTSYCLTALVNSAATQSQRSTKWLAWQWLSV